MIFIPPLNVIGLAQLSNLVQKCDAKRPCETCIQSKCASECIYDDERLPSPTSVRLLHSADGYLPGRQHSEDPVDISTPSSIDGAFVDMLSSAKSKLMCSALDSIRLVTEEPSDLQQVPHSNSSGLVLFNKNAHEQCISPDTTPLIDISFLPTIVLPELSISLSFMGAEKLQVQISDIDATSMDMRSCVYRNTIPSITNSLQH